MKILPAVLAFALGLMGAGNRASGPEAAQPTPLAQLTEQRRDAAHKTYQLVWANYRERRASEDTLYRWSVHWMEAERDASKVEADRATAYKSHLERMRTLERLIRNLQRSGQVTVDVVS